MANTAQLDTGDLTKRVKDMYREVALSPEHDFHFETGRALAERLGYPAADLDRIPAAPIDSFAGVGYFLDLAAIEPGEVVVDLGSGSGTDAFLAALAAREEGRVVGIDMTAEQLAKARRLAEEAGIFNTDFRRGMIEEPPVEAGSVDCVISNGVINLAPDKAAVFEAAAAILRPPGRLAIADIVSARQLPEGVTCDASLWAACIGGAMQHDRYLETIAPGWLRDRRGPRERLPVRLRPRRQRHAEIRGDQHLPACHPHRGGIEMIDDIASWSRRCLTMQGYGALGDGERRNLWLGLRFAPALCLLGVALGTALASPALLFAMAATAMVGGFITPKHPFDYLYDLALRPLLGGPSIPAGPAPRRFACQLATPWIAAIAVAFLADAPTLGWVLAVPLLVAAATVTATNWCLPSFIYGLLHRRAVGAAAR